MKAMRRISPKTQGCYFPLARNSCLREYPYSWGTKVMPQATTNDDAFSRLPAIIADSTNRNRNEAETRHKVIDFILHDLLTWPRNRVAVEENIHPGFADYILKKANGDPLVFVEAKKEGLYFELPLPHNADETSAYIAIKKLLTDSNIKAAANQVRAYCADTGCEYACITNGHEWIFFKTFEKNVRWDSLNALVIRKLDFFEREYTRAVNSLSFLAITERSALPSILGSTPPRDRSLFYPKEKISAYSHIITANKFASKLRPIANYYFGVISDDDTEFMTRCYVSDRDYASTHAGNRMDHYSESVDQVKITNYGMYMFNMLGFEFTYLDLICTDCGIFDQEVSNYLSEAARIEYGHFIKRQSLKRVEIRLERVGRFNDYLRSEEEREREMYSLGMPQAEMFTTRLLATFEAEKERIKRSAAKNLRGRQR
jgi:hypothetical protein